MCNYLHNFQLFALSLPMLNPCRQPTFLAPEISYFNFEPGSTKVGFYHDGCGGDDDDDDDDDDNDK